MSPRAPKLLVSFKRVHILPGPIRSVRVVSGRRGIGGRGVEASTSPPAGGYSTWLVPKVKAVCRRQGTEVTDGRDWLTKPVLVRALEMFDQQGSLKVVRRWRRGRALPCVADWRKIGAAILELGGNRL